MSQTRFLQQLRSRLYTGDKAKETAILAVKSQMSTANDGSFVLGRYQDAENNIRTIIGANYINAGVNSMSIYDFDKIASDALLARVSTVETTLGISEDGTVTGETIVGRIDDVEDLLEVLNGAETVEGSIKKQIKDAVDAEAAIARAAEKANADNIAAEVSARTAADSNLQTEINNEVSARTAADTQIRTDFAAADDTLQKAIDYEVQARQDDDTALKNELMGDVSDTDAKTIAALNDKIESVEGAAKSYSIVNVTEGLDANVKEAWKLVDEDGVQSGSQINIYKDSSLQKVELVNQELRFTYILADSSNSTVGVDVSNFLAESEFADGLQVVNGVVSIKVADGSETFLSVSENGIKLSGVQDAIAAEKTRAEEQETAIRGEFATADTTLKNTLLGDAAEGYNTLGKLEDAIQAVDAKVEALDVEDEEVVGSYVTKVDQVNGKISTVKKSLVSSANENNMLVADTTNGGLTLSTVWDCGTFEYELPSTEG